MGEAAYFGWGIGISKQSGTMGEDVVMAWNQVLGSLEVVSRRHSGLQGKEYIHKLGRGYEEVKQGNTVGRTWK